VQSKDPKFAEGDHVVGELVWQDWSVAPAKALTKLPADVKVPYSYYIGAMGMPGVTAYFGFLDICQPKQGDVVVVSGAAGAVGSVVGQIAKIKGCTVIGIAGSDDKLEWLKKLGFDHVINYKTQDIAKELATAAPNGVNCYFDNVGGATADTVLNAMAVNGRVCCCGAISGYSRTEPDIGPRQYGTIVSRGLKLQGFIVSRDFGSRWPEAVKQLTEWVVGGQLKAEQTVVEGLENLPQAFIDMLRGKNFGKMLVKVASD